jgi:hypothetical protein
MLLTQLMDSHSVSKMILESQWEMPKGYSIASGQFLKNIGKPLRNTQITPIPVGP